MNKLPNELTNYVKEFVIFKPEDYEEIKYAVKEWIIENDNALEYYGHISTWDTSLITDMSYLFYFNDSENWREHTKNLDPKNPDPGLARHDSLPFPKIVAD